MNSRRLLLWMGVGAAVVLAAGCRREAEPAAVTPAPAAAGDQAPAPEADLTAVLAALTQQVRKYGFEKQRVPASLEELVTAGYLSALPEAPAGQKFAINPKTMQVILTK